MAITGRCKVTFKLWTTDLRVQIMSLWQLLESEKARLAQANLKAMQQHVLAEEALVNNKALTTLNNNQQKEIADLNKEVLALRTECHNQKNELIVSKQEIFSLHTQMDKERVKVTKLREDKKILLDKAHAAEAEVKKKIALLSQCESEQKLKDDVHMSLSRSLEVKNQEIEELTVEKIKIYSELDEKVQENDNLERKILELKTTIEEKEREIDVLKKTSHGYMVEAVQMRLANLKQEEKDELVQKGGNRILSLILAIIPLLKAIAFP